MLFSPFVPPSRQRTRLVDGLLLELLLFLPVHVADAREFDPPLDHLEPEFRHVVENFPDEEFRDVDCDYLRGGFVKWSKVREAAEALDSRWSDFSFPTGECHKLKLWERSSSEVFLSLTRPDRSASECPLGGLTAALLSLICADFCLGGELEARADPVGAASAVVAAAASSSSSSSAAESLSSPVSQENVELAQSAFEYLWNFTLAGPKPLPIYMLGTTSWPIGALLSRWQGHCRTRGGDLSGRRKMPQQTTQPGLCLSSEVSQFESIIDSAAVHSLLPVIFQGPSIAKNADLPIGAFANVMLPALTTFMSGATTAAPSFTKECPSTTTAQGVMLIFLRLLGPPAGRNDPLDDPRLSDLGRTAGRLKLEDILLRLPLAVPAALALSSCLTWRSHRLYGGGADVPLNEVRRVLLWGATLMQKHHQAHRVDHPKLGLLQSVHHRRDVRTELWGAVGRASEDGVLGELWGLIARWLIAGLSMDQMWPGPVIPGASPSSPVFFTMAFGGLPEYWVRSFLTRALDVGITRLIFISPEVELLRYCEDVVREEKAEAKMLCVRVMVPFGRPYDFNNKAKFYLFPILLSLGLDVAWLDFDIFVFKNPASRLLAQAYDTANPKDVVVTDHFDEYCLNHGVFLVRATDRALLWLIEYIRWMHWYPYGHDQNGWDALLGHSIHEPQMTKDLFTNPNISASHGVLSTELEYVTLTGWAGDLTLQRQRALLLHYTTTHGISGYQKHAQLLQAFKAAGRQKQNDTGGLLQKRRVDMVIWKLLHRLQMGLPKFKRPCYEGIHSAIADLLRTGLYEELLA